MTAVEMAKALASVARGLDPVHFAKAGGAKSTAKGKSSAKAKAKAGGGTKMQKGLGNCGDGAGGFAQGNTCARGGGGGGKPISQAENDAIGRDAFKLGGMGKATPAVAKAKAAAKAKAEPKPKPAATKAAQAKAPAKAAKPKAEPKPKATAEQKAAAKAEKTAATAKARAEKAAATKDAKAKAAAEKATAKATAKEAAAKAKEEAKSAKAAAKKAAQDEQAAKVGDRLDSMTVKQIKDVQKGYLGKTVGKTKADMIAAVRAKAAADKAAVSAPKPAAPATPAPAPAPATPKSKPAAAAAPKPAASPAASTPKSTAKGYSPKADTKGDDVPNPATKSHGSDAAEQAAGQAYRNRYDYPLKTVDMPAPKLAAARAEMDSAFVASPGAKSNYVKITEIRERMPGLSREEQDTVIMKAVADKQYGLDTHEGLADSKISATDRRSSIVTTQGEGDRKTKTRYVYIQKR